MGGDGGDGDGGQVYPGAAGQDQGGQGAGQDNAGNYDPSIFNFIAKLSQKQSPSWAEISLISA